MADWTDGAQYAPLERPDAFAMPSADPLAGTTRTPGLAEGRPDSAPARYAEPEGTVALEALEPARGPQRDPQEPFTEGSTSSGWGAVHASWQPTMPLGDPAAAEPTASFPPPAGPTASFPPPAGPPTVPATAGAAGDGTPLPPGAFPPPTGAPVAFPPPAEAVPEQSSSSAWPRDPYAALPGPPTSQPVPQQPSPPQSAEFPPAPQFPPPAQLPPEPWQQAAPTQAPGQQFPAPQVGQPPAPASNRVVELVSGLGPVMLGALVLGLLWPAVSVIALVIASWLTTRTRLGLRVIRPAFNGAFLVLLVGWLSSLAGTPVVDYGVLARIICLVLLVTSLAAGWADLSRRR